MGGLEHAKRGIAFLRKSRPTPPLCLHFQGITQRRRAAANAVDIPDFPSYHRDVCCKPGIDLLPSLNERCARLIKQDLIQRIVERTGLPRNKAEAAVDAIFSGMKQALAAGERIELRGFGVFNVKPRKTGVGRNPRTGKKVDITPGRAVRFKPGKELQDLE